MIRKLILGLSVSACVALAIGCDGAKDAGKAATSSANAGAAKGAEVAKGMAEKANEAAKGVADKAGDAAKGAGDAVKDAGKAVADAGKETVLKPINEFMPKIEEKLKGLTGDAGTKAKEKFEAFKKMLEEFKASPADKIKDLGAKLTEAFGELKKLVGL